MGVALAVAAWGAMLAMGMGVILRVRRYQVPADRRRELRHAAARGFAVWAVVGVALLSPFARLIPERVWPILSPFVMTLWPSWSLAAFLARRLPAGSGLLMFLLGAVAAVLWAAILWSPVLALRWRRMPIWLGLAGQGMLWIAVIALYRLSLPV